MPQAAHPVTPSGRQALVRHSAYIFLIRAFPALAALIVLILFPRQLPAEVYGQYQNFWIQWPMLNAIACLGLPAFLLTYPVPELHHFLSGLGRRGVVLLTGCMAAAGVVFSLIQERAGLLPFWLPAVYLVLHAAISILESFLMVSRRFRFLAVSNLLYAGIFVLLHGLVLRQALSIPGLFYGLLATGAVRLLLFGVPAVRQFRAVRYEADLARPERMGRLWLHLGIYDVSQSLFRWLDKFVVSLLLSPEVSALYFIGTIDIPFLPLLLGAVGGGLLLQMSDRSLPDGERVRMLCYSSEKLGRLVFPLFFFLMAFRQELFHVVFGGKYDAAVPLFFVTTLVVPLRAYNFTALLQHKGAGGLINKGSLLDMLLAVGLMYPLFRLLGLQGIALAFVLSTWVQAGYYLYHTSRLTGFRVGELLPGKAWGLQAIVFATGFIGLHYISALVFNPLITLILGGSALMVVLTGALIPLLRNKYSARGQTIPS